MDKLTLTLPWPPSVNAYWTERVISGRIIKFVGQKGKIFKHLVREQLQPHLDHCEEHFDKDARISLQIIVRPPDRRKRDIDNLQKAILDALEDGGAFENDEQVDEIHIKRDKDDIIKGGEIIVTIGVIKG